MIDGLHYEVYLFPAVSVARNLALYLKAALDPHRNILGLIMHFIALAIYRNSVNSLSAGT